MLRYIYPKVLCDSYGALRYRSALDTTQKFLNKVTCGALRYRQKSEIVNHRFVAALSPYLTRHIKRYGDYVVNLQNIPQPFEAAISLPSEIFEI